jgi:hypothetical protein
MAKTYSRNGKVSREVARGVAEEPRGCNCLCPGRGKVSGRKGEIQVDLNFQP